MKTKVIVNGKGEPQETQIEIPIVGSGSELGKRALINLVALINTMKHAKIEAELEKDLYMISGYAMCCHQCGFITKKSMDDVMDMVEHMAGDELVRIKAGK